MKVEIWSDVVCPWCYLGTRRLEHALERVPFRDEVSVVHRSFQLDPSAPVGSTHEVAALLAERYRLSPEQVDDLQTKMEERAAQEGLEYHLEHQRSGNTFDAHRLVHLAAERGLQSEVVERLFRAHFTEGRSVFDHGSLAEIAAEAGLDPVEVAEVLAGDRYTEEVRADIDQARRYGVRGVPFYVLEGKLAVSGAQPVEALQEALEQAYASV
ncbi:MAG: FrnE protein [Acidimicrobiaceae bacterium]|nr:FrnE protein [Acidimicrobiaceae bacterium]